MCFWFWRYFSFLWLCVTLLPLCRDLSRCICCVFKHSSWKLHGDSEVPKFQPQFPCFVYLSYAARKRDLPRKPMTAIYPISPPLKADRNIQSGNCHYLVSVATYFEDSVSQSLPHLWMSFPPNFPIRNFRLNTFFFLQNLPLSSHLFSC